MIFVSHIHHIYKSFFHTCTTHLSHPRDIITDIITSSHIYQILSHLCHNVILLVSRIHHIYESFFHTCTTIWSHPRDIIIISKKPLSHFHQNFVTYANFCHITSQHVTHSSCLHQTFVTHALNFRPICIITDQEPTLGKVLHSGRLWLWPSNFRLGWKDLPWTKSLAYYAKAVKIFITLAPLAKRQLLSLQLKLKIVF